MAFSDLNDINFDGVNYYADEQVIKSLLVIGTEPTDWEQYNRVNILVLHRNAKESNGIKAGGTAQANYHYGHANDVYKFHEIGYPMRIDAKVVTTTDRKGNKVELVVDIDFKNVKKLEWTEVKSTSSTNTKTNLNS